MSHVSLFQKSWGEIAGKLAFVLTKVDQAGGHSIRWSQPQSHSHGRLYQCPKQDSLMRRRARQARPEALRYVPYLYWYLSQQRVNTEKAAAIGMYQLSNTWNYTSAYETEGAKESPKLWFRNRHTHSPNRMAAIRSSCRPLEATKRGDYLRNLGGLLSDISQPQPLIERLNAAEASLADDHAIQKVPGK